MIGNDLIRITENDLDEFLQMPCDNFVEVPSKGELINFLHAINCTLENGRIPRKIYKNHLPKE